MAAFLVDFICLMLELSPAFRGVVALTNELSGLRFSALSRLSICTKHRVADAGQRKHSVALGRSLLAIFLIFSPMKLSVVEANTTAPSAVDSMGQLTPKLRKEIAQFLSGRFEAKGISDDLRDLVLERINLAALGRPSQFPDPSSARLRDHPSVAQQIEWQYSLAEIAEDFRRAFPTAYEPRQPAVMVDENGPPISPVAEELLWRVPKLIEGAQGAFSFQFAKQPIPRDFGARGVAVERVGSWKSPLRFSASGVERFDERLASEIKHNRANTSGVSLSIDPTPAGLGDANVYIPAKGSTGSTLDRLWLCANYDSCSSLSNLARAADARGARTDKGFFRDLYLSNPYGIRSSSTIVFQLRAGHPVAAFAGTVDLGYMSLENAAEPIRPDGLQEFLRNVSRPFAS